MMKIKQPKAKPTNKSYSPTDCIIWDDSKSGVARDPLQRFRELSTHDECSRPRSQAEVDSQDKIRHKFAGTINILVKDSGEWIITIGLSDVDPPESETLKRRGLWNDEKARRIYYAAESIVLNRTEKRHLNLIFKAIQSCDVKAIESLRKSIEVLKTMPVNEKGLRPRAAVTNDDTIWAIQNAAKKAAIKRTIPTIREVGDELEKIQKRPSQSGLTNRLQEIGFGWLPDDNASRGNRDGIQNVKRGKNRGSPQL